MTSCQYIEDASKHEKIDNYGVNSEKENEENNSLNNKNGEANTDKKEEVATKAEEKIDDASDTNRKSEEKSIAAEQKEGQKEEQKEELKEDKKEEAKNIDTDKKQKTQPETNNTNDLTDKKISENNDNYTINKKPELEDLDIQNIANNELNWWYRPAKEYYKNIPATINKEIEELLNKYGGYYRASSGNRELYLTFDEGYEHNNNTEKILDVLKSKNIKAAFFITGHYLRTREDLVKRMIDEGHVVANHTDNHKNGVKALNENVDVLVKDIENLNELFKEKFGRSLDPFMRPPAGVYSERSLYIINKLGYTPIFWSFAYRDWLTNDQPDPKESLEKTTGLIFDGSIILLHAVSDTNAEILGDFIDFAVQNGYSFKSLYEIK